MSDRVGQFTNTQVRVGCGEGHWGRPWKCVGAAGPGRAGEGQSGGTRSLQQQEDGYRGRLHEHRVPLRAPSAALRGALLWHGRRPWHEVRLAQVTVARSCACCSL